MPKMTKTQAKRMVKDILGKTQKLYLSEVGGIKGYTVNTNDMQAVERLTAKWLKRLG
jgi:hypothetical protein